MKSADSKTDISELIKVSKEALASARILDYKNLESSLCRRKQLIMKLWNLPSDLSFEKIADHSRYIKRGIKVKVQAKDREELQLLDKELKRTLNSHQSDLRKEKSSLYKGERLMNNLRELCYSPGKSRCDFVG